MNVLLLNAGSSSLKAVLMSGRALGSMVVWVTLDLEPAQRGWIRVSQEPLQQLLKSTQK